MGEISSSSRDVISVLSFRAVVWTAGKTEFAFISQINQSAVPWKGQRLLWKIIVDETRPVLPFAF